MCAHCGLDSVRIPILYIIHPVAKMDVLKAADCSIPLEYRAAMTWLDLSEEARDLSSISRVSPALPKRSGPSVAVLEPSPLGASPPLACTASVASLRWLFR